MHRRPGPASYETTTVVVGVAVLTLVLHGLLYLAQRSLYSPDTRRVAALTWWTATVAMYVTYAFVLWVCSRDVVSRKWRTVLLFVPALAHVAWIFTGPVLSIDLYSYLTDSFAARLGINPYLQAPKDWAGTTLASELEQYGWRPKHGAAPYGPIWILLMVAVGHTRLGVAGAALTVKTFLALCTVGSAVLVWQILSVIRPSRRLFGIVAFGWNPLLLEITGEGHNDAVMVFGVLAALWLVIRQRHRAGALALTVATLTKFVPAVFAPAFLVCQARNEPGGARLIRQWLATGVVCSAVVVLSYAPLWAGRHTFDGLQSSMERRMGAGTSGLLIVLLSDVVGPPAAVTIAGVLVLTVFLVGGTAATWRVVDGRTLVNACGTICLLYVLVATSRWWPWYALLPCAVLCASGGLREVWLGTVLSICCRTTAPLSVLQRVNAISWSDFVTISTLLGAWLPLLSWAAWVVLARLLSRRQLMGLMRNKYLGIDDG